ncbi:hypothetical protein CWI38_0541p0020 [Hamiltosporidium tvaerminnensis]|uniref:Uncharacterized protein n=1 Tax=Hamiltosporidium tvaerminnensis TaxID=1176355 RepID=A0A4Q9LXG4_9MICR|nr:hypothetical protein CWI38_1035p0010 [Hamiltosporidium tvaerminnensis]TBU13066.1 hypothetical protein CWI38_0541p0020 [Hamiltosporidium tvaerminnensis]
MILSSSSITNYNIYPSKDKLDNKYNLIFEDKTLIVFFTNINEHNRLLYEWMFLEMDNIATITFLDLKSLNYINIEECINCLLYKENMSLEIMECLNVKNYIRNIDKFRVKKLKKMKLEDIHLTLEDLSSFLEFKNIDNIEFDNCSFDEGEISGEFTFVFSYIQINNMKISNLVVSFLKKAFFGFLYLKNVEFINSFGLLNIFSDTDGGKHANIIELTDLNLNDNFFDLIFYFKNLNIIEMKSVENVSFKIKNKERLELIRLKRISIKDCGLTDEKSNIWFISGLNFLILYRIKNISALFKNINDEKNTESLEVLKIKGTPLCHSDMENISKFSNLINLKLHSCNLDSSHLIYIKKVTFHAEFRKIILTNNKIYEVPGGCRGIFKNFVFAILDRCNFCAGSISLLFEEAKKSCIEVLDFSYNSLNRNDLIFISAFKKLVVLKINGVKLEGDAELDNLTLKGLTKNLKYLEIKQLNISTKDIEALAKFTGLTEIRLSEEPYIFLNETNIKIPCKTFKIEKIINFDLIDSKETDLK